MKLMCNDNDIIINIIININIINDSNEIILIILIDV